MAEEVQRRLEQQQQAIEAMSTILERLRTTLAEIQAHQPPVQQEVAAGAQAASMDTAEPPRREEEPRRPSTKMPASVQQTPKLKSLTDPEAFRAWRNFWNLLIRIEQPDPSRAAVWMCLHTEGDAASLLQNLDKTPSSPQQVFDRIIATARSRARDRGVQAHPQGLEPRASETPRQYGERLIAHQELFDMPSSQLAAIAIANTRSITDVRQCTRSTSSMEEWIKAVSDAHIADIPFEQLEDVGRPKTDTTQVAAVATNAKGGRKGAKRFPGKCFACSRPGHRVSECHDKTALAQYNRHKAAAITPTTTATAGQGATTSSSSSSSGTSS